MNNKPQEENKPVVFEFDGQKFTKQEVAEAFESAPARFADLIANDLKDSLRDAFECGEACGKALAEAEMKDLMRPLCMKSAIEKGYTSDKNRNFKFEMWDSSDCSWFEKDANSELGRAIKESNYFYPCDNYGLPDLEEIKRLRILGVQPWEGE